ncbi:zinc finger translocation-associated protein isoform X2 [Hyperolius riggenbachi]|uniref:zinc finger translocation-associated protein isoform X2 n=1 Tax=Hyperolius riggenbachi TaxID=752182 RepID=UPI0035A29BAD
MYRRRSGKRTEGQVEERQSVDMQRAPFSEKEPEVTLGPRTSSAGESLSRCGSVDLDRSTITDKEEAAREAVTVSPGPKKKRRRLPPVVKGSWRPLVGSEVPQPPLPDKNQIEQYMNESLKQWLRLEFLMDYDFQGSKLHCMMCTTALPSLSITDIKSHVLDNHPTSIYFNPAQKSIIVESWINRKEMPEEIVDVEEEMDEDEEEVEIDLTKSELHEEQLDEVIAEPGHENNSVKETINGEIKKERQENKESVWVLETGHFNARKALKAEEKKIQEENNRLQDEENHILKEKPLEEEHRKAKQTKLTEELKADQGKKQEKARETTLKEKQCDTKAVQENGREAALLEKEEKKTKNAEVLEGTICRAAEKPLLQEDKCRGEGTLLLEKEESKTQGQPLLDRKQKIMEAQLLGVEMQTAKDIKQGKEQCKSTDCKLEKAEVKVADRMELVKGKEAQTQLNTQVKVKIEDEETVEPILMPKGQVQATVIEAKANNIKTEHEQQLGPKLVEEDKKVSVVQVQQIPQTPAMLGIGVPLLKVETPTPIIITRLSVMPELPVLATPKPSTSTPDVSKTYRVIAPKTSAVPEELTIQNPSPSPSSDSSQWPAGIDPLIWEISVWQGNSNNSINCSQNSFYQMRWRSDYLMDYNGLRGSVVCMYCCSALTVLKESSIRRHISQKHAHTANFSAEERASVILDWENKLAEVKKMMAKQNKEVINIGDSGMDVLKTPDCDTVEEEEQESSWAGALSEGKSASWEFAFGRVQGKAPKDPRKYQHDRWKLEFLMDYTPTKDGLICMVCGVTLINPKITTVKMHIQQKHPDTIYLSDQEKAVVIEEWEQRLTAGKKGSGHQTGDDEICIEIKEDSTTSESKESTTGTSTPRTEIVLPAINKPPKPTTSLPPPCNSAKRSYQVRWRTEFMMDYDCRRQGLICMVCGGTLATLKVSTIKRHIVQVHPYSVDFTPEERQRILEAYSEMALHYIHSEECFKAQPQEEVKGRKRKSASVEEA